MRTALDCVPCFIRQALDSVRFVSGNPEFHEHILKRVLVELSEIDYSVTPPEVGGRVHRLVRQLANSGDPYADIKRSFTERARAVLPELRERVRASDDPFVAALRLAGAGNIIDLAPNGALRSEDVDAAIERAYGVPVDDRAVESLRTACGRADSILYLADNAGELVFDRLLLEQLPAGRVQVAVKGGAVINDATREDAEQAGIADLAEIIDTGADTPGLVLAGASEEFRAVFEAADVVIAKGQGNYEALSTAPREVFFLLIVKCDVVAEDIGTHTGTLYVGHRVPEEVSYAGWR
ncbi:MAG: damage-control phosphatase ARMT1 family protein [Spirochaetaceae bacterium]